MPSAPAPSGIRGGNSISCDCSACQTLLSSYTIPVSAAPCTQTTCDLCHSIVLHVADEMVRGMNVGVKPPPTQPAPAANDVVAPSSAPPSQQPAPVVAPVVPAEVAPASAFPPMEWMKLQPHHDRFIGPELIFDRTELRGPTTPRIKLVSGERIPMHPLGYMDSDTNKVIEWRVADGSIISYVWDNEKSHFEAFTKATRPCAHRAPGSPAPLFLDVGANHGLFGLLAVARGCAVEFYDPQRKCGDILEKSVALLPADVIARPVKVVIRPVGTSKSSLRTVYGMICAGTFSSHNGDMKPWKGGAGEWGETYAPFEGFDAAKVPMDAVNVSYIALDEVIAGRHVVALKIDVEGFESDALSSGMASFAAGLVDLFVVEINGHQWKLWNWDIAEKAEPFIALVRDHGYRVKLMRGRDQLGDPADAFRMMGGEKGESDPDLFRNHLLNNLWQMDVMFVAKHFFE